MLHKKGWQKVVKILLSVHKKSERACNFQCAN